MADFLSGTINISIWWNHIHPSIHLTFLNDFYGFISCLPLILFFFFFFVPCLIDNMYFIFIYLFIFFFLAVLGLRFCARAFSSCGKWGPLLIAVLGPLLLWSTGSRRAGSVVVAHGPSCSAACGIFPDQGSNPRPLH